MPFLPFGGLSMIVHLLIIGVKKTVKKIHVLSEKYQMKALCLLIIVATLSVVILTAGFILTKSIESDVSNMALIGRYLEKPTVSARAASESTVTTPPQQIPFYVLATLTKKIPEKQVVIVVKNPAAVPSANMSPLIDELQNMKDMLLQLQEVIDQTSTPFQPSENP